MQLTNMSNKYLEKAAALFPSMGYQKTLNKDEKKQYKHQYETAGTSSISNVGRSAVATTALSVGSAAGAIAGASAAKPLSQRIASHLKDKNLAAGKYRMADGSHNLSHIIADGRKVHGRVGTAAVLTGAVLGAIPGASYSDHFRHNHAKKVIEQRRNKEND
jgi:hypothetical protein